MMWLNKFKKALLVHVNFQSLQMRRGMGLLSLADVHRIAVNRVDTN